MRVRGFTAVELLIVICVIGILGAIVAGTVENAKDPMAPYRAEVREHCVHGFAYVEISRRVVTSYTRIYVSVEQVLDEEGRRVRCKTKGVEK